MRNIIFRAKVKRPDVAFVGDFEPDGTWTYGEVHLNHRVPHIHTGFGRRPIDPETVGLDSGLKDKNGISIFEGDIVEWSFFSYDESVEKIERHLVEVKWHKGCLCIFPLPNDKSFESGICWSLEEAFSDRTDAVKAGNIYDNPELKEGGEE